MADEPRISTDALEKRVVLLESAVRALATELEQLRTPPTGSPLGARPEPKFAPKLDPEFDPKLDPKSDPKSGSWLPADIDFESLIGRYGTLVLATASALAAVGLFLSWAIDKGLLGPSQRIALGLLTAAGLAVGGLRLRRSERSFGASLLGLALAIALVCAWGAGPALQLIPTWVAFLFAAVASIALAVFAHAEDDEPLWSVGFSGAAIAPFVTSSGQGNIGMLTAYGVMVLVAAGYAMGRRPWVVAGRLFLLASSAYTVALAAASETKGGPLLAMLFPLAVAVLAVLPFIDGARRRERLRALGALGALAAFRAALGKNLPFEPNTVAALIATGGLLWLVVVDRTHEKPATAPTSKRRLVEGDWLDAAVLPLGFILAGAIALDASDRGSGIALAGAAAALLITVVRLPQGSLRDAAVFATVISALISTLLLLRGRELEIMGAVSLLAAACFAGNVVWRSTSWTMLGLIGFAWGALAIVVELSERAWYSYAMFGTKESAAAAVLLASIAAAWRLTRHDAKLANVLRGAIAGWAFVWVHQELAWAVSQTVATLLRVTYYAATSVAAVGIGRARGIALLRHIGLGLAVIAAATALYGARNLTLIGARIGADLVAAVFLLAIAYWYRRPGGSRPEVSGLGRLRNSQVSGGEG
ncbi:MAG: DUF2339 domain-containing protein [Gemmatimonadaceae bacterium]